MPPTAPGDLVEKARQLKKDLDAFRLEASVGGGMVRVSMDGNRSVVAVRIEPEAAEDVEMLQDLLRAGFNEASRQVEAHSTGKVTRLLGMPSIVPGT